MCKKGKRWINDGNQKYSIFYLLVAFRTKSEIYFWYSLVFLLCENKRKKKQYPEKEINKKVFEKKYTKYKYCKNKQKLIKRFLIWFKNGYLNVIYKWK